MHKADVYIEGVKYSFIGLVVGMSSIIVVDGVLDLRILSGSGLKGLKLGFWDLRPSIHQIDFDFFKKCFLLLYLTKQSSG